MNVSRALFNLGARAGSLEGYIYEGKTVDAHYLPGWVANLEKEFAELPQEVRSEVQGDLVDLMKKIQKSLRSILAPDDPTLARVGKIIAGAS